MIERKGIEMTKQIDREIKTIEKKIQFAQGFLNELHECYDFSLRYVDDIREAMANLHELEGKLCELNQKKREILEERR